MRNTRYFPMPDPDLPPCAPHVRENVLLHFDKVHKRVMRIRAWSLIVIGLVVILVVGRYSWRISARGNPAELAGPNVQHGIPPKPPSITPKPDTQPAIQRWIVPRQHYFRYPKANKNGIQPLGGPQPLREIPMLS